MDIQNLSQSAAATVTAPNAAPVDPPPGTSVVTKIVEPEGIDGTWFERNQNDIVAGAIVAALLLAGVLLAFLKA